MCLATGHTLEGVVQFVQWLAGYLYKDHIIVLLSTSIIVTFNKNKIHKKETYLHAHMPMVK